MSKRRNTRRDELLADRATVGLSEREVDELRSLGASPGDLEDTDELSFELAAAAAHLALVENQEGLPELLGKRVENQARGFFAGRAATAEPGRAARSRWPLMAAALGCAAAVLIALWSARRPGERPQPAADGRAIEQRPRSAADMRASLLSRADDAILLPWQVTDDIAARGATGDVVWSDAAQAGYMRIRGLMVNDPRALQYQLWIFDPARDERYPVDGGVFDVAPGTDEVVVPIDVKLPVRGPTLFAVTVERPGGVVVSTRERIALLAKVQGS